MKTLIILFLFSFNTYAANCQKHPIYCQIVKNKPKINKKYAMRLSNIIYKMHRKYHIPSRVFTAILMQESRYKLNAKGCHSGYRKETQTEQMSRCLHKSNKDKYILVLDKDKYAFLDRCLADKVKLIESRICTDFGITQIYYKTAKRWKFDINKLTTDLEYSVEAGAKVLHDIMERFEAKDNDYWVRYNCGFRSTTKRDTCQIYKKLVKRYM